MPRVEVIELFVDLVAYVYQVTSWVVHVIHSGTTTEEKLALLSCLVRVAQTCWNIGNFNSAMEIVAAFK